MPDKKHITELAEQHLAGTDKFLVDLNVSPAGKIEVYIDSINGLSVKDCVELSRYIESSLDREKEDFELEVSSPGAEEPFKVPQQYAKNIGRKLKVITNEGNEYQGLLTNFENNSITLETSRKEKKEKGNGKIKINENITLELDKVKKAGVILSFK